MKHLLYLASPYKHDNPEVMLARVDAIENVVIEIMRSDSYFLPISPIAYTHYLDRKMKEPFDYYTWDLELLRQCGVMLVVQLEGWNDSEGVTLELGFCKEEGIIFDYAEPHQVLEVLEKLELRLRRGRS